MQAHTDGFKYRTVRCEWQVVIQDVDQYGMDTKERSVVSVWPTHSDAQNDLHNHGYKHRHVSNRWIPHNAAHGYQELQIQYREVEM